MYHTISERHITPAKIYEIVASGKTLRLSEQAVERIRKCRED